MIKSRDTTIRKYLCRLAVGVIVLIIAAAPICHGYEQIVFFDDFEDSIMDWWSTYSSTNAFFDEVEGVMAITANGADVWMGYDEYGAVYTSVTGDFDAIVKVVSQEYTHEWAKAGIAVRNSMSQSATPSSPGSLGYAFMLVTPGNGIGVEWDAGGFASSNSVAALRNHPRFPNDPDGSETITSFEGPTNWADAYGQRISGHITPTEGGVYQFAIASDDNSELWLSTDDTRDNCQLIASVPEWTNSRDWGKYPLQQQSAPILLQAGQQYYIEALHKEGGGGDNLAVAWMFEGESTWNVITGDFLREWWTGDYRDGFVDSYIGAGTGATPCWLKLTKRGTTFTGYYSTSGPHSWVSLGSTTDETAEFTQDVGMAVTSHSDGDLCTVEFDDFELHYGRMVALDLLPGGCPNPLNLKRNGVFSAAVLGESDFVVADIAPWSVGLTRDGAGGAIVMPIRHQYEDVATPFDGAPCDCHTLEQDGYIDLTLKFDVQELAAKLELDEVTGQTVPLILIGTLRDGTAIQGMDCIRVKD